MLYEWDPDKASSNLAKHDIDFADAVSVLGDDQALTVLQEHEEEIATRLLEWTCSVVYWWWSIHCAMRIPSGSSRHGEQAVRNASSMRVNDMSDEIDFSQGKRGAVDQLPGGKTRVTIRIDDDVLDWFRAAVNQAGGGNYQTMINAALREYILRQQETL
jgi:uncharacterized protein (DUF4415 family)/uncharacterized DUF497 family protein